MSDPFLPYHRLLALFLALNVLAVGLPMSAWVFWIDRRERRFTPAFKSGLVLTGIFLWPFIPYWRGQCGRSACIAGCAGASAFIAATIFLYRGLSLSATTAVYEARAKELIDKGDYVQARRFADGVELLNEAHARQIRWILPKEAEKLSDSARRLRQSAEEKL